MNVLCSSRIMDWFCVVTCPLNVWNIVWHDATMELQGMPTTVILEGYGRYGHLLKIGTPRAVGRQRTFSQEYNKHDGTYWNLGRTAVTMHTGWIKYLSIACSKRLLTKGAGRAIPYRVTRCDRFSFEAFAGSLLSINKVILPPQNRPN